MPLGTVCLEQLDQNVPGGGARDTSVPMFDWRSTADSAASCSGALGGHHLVHRDATRMPVIALPAARTLLRIRFPLSEHGAR